MAYVFAKVEGLYYLFEDPSLPIEIGVRQTHLNLSSMLKLCKLHLYEPSIDIVPYYAFSFLSYPFMVVGFIP